jgi:hypothetical protein
MFHIREHRKDGAMKNGNRLVVSIQITVLFLTALMAGSCNNLSWEDVPEKTGTALHPSFPPFSRIYHGADYRFPADRCDEPQCHGRVLTGGNSGAPSCLACHDDQWSVFSVSHRTKVSGYYHHSSVDSGNFISTCGISGCHGNGSSLYSTNQTGYNYRFACYSCHDPIPPPGHRVSKEGVRHHYNIGKDPHVYCYMSGCHGTGQPGGKCGRCHSSDYPTGD